MDQEVTLTPNVEGPKQAVVKPKKLRKPKVTIRTVAELEGVSFKKMTEQEKILILVTQEAQLHTLDAQLNQTRQAAESAFSKFRKVEAQFRAYRREAQGKFHFARKAISTCHDSIILMGNLNEGDDADGSD